MSPEWTQANEINIGQATMGDADKILALIGKAPDALLTVSQEQIHGWIENGQSIVAKNAMGQVIGHQGMAYWEEANLVELRSAYVDPEARGMGINTKMKLWMIENAVDKYPGAKIIGFTEAASKSRGILQKLGFDEYPLHEAPEELFSICPPLCFKNTGQDCGCKIYVLDPAGKSFK
jgi:N-acetylglutamate synthase-like GNAT family acetyltransferase